MTKKVFAWFPDMGSQKEVTPTVNVTKFGDGYELRSSSVINTKPEKWSLTFSRIRPEAREILDFIEGCGAVESFLWTTPFEKEGTFVCRKWNARSDRGMIIVTCDFEQVYEY